MSESLSTITGLVLDTRGTPVEGARVYFVRGPCPLPDIAALTGSSGYFTLPVPILGTYQIGVSHEGFTQKRMKVDVREEEHRVVLEVRLD